MQKFHTIIIGAGSGGLTVAIGLAKTGKKVALVERGLIGGDCTNYGCIPSKAFLDIARKGEKKGIQNILQEVRKRRKHIQDEETKQQIEKYGIQVFQGEGKFVGEHEISINDQEIISGKYLVIATGSHAQTFDIPGIPKKNNLTHKEIFEIEEDIKNLVIIGGGYIGCEMAEAFQLSGVHVTLLQRNKFLIPREEKEASIFMKEYLEKIGVIVYNEVEDIFGEDEKIVGKTKNNRQIKIDYNKVLVALGRLANIDNIGLNTIALEYDKKGVFVDNYNRTNKKYIFAIGDTVYNNMQFTHLANHEGRKVIRNILFPYILSTSKNTIIPSCLYTTYEVARVGKTETECEESYGKEGYKTYIYHLTSNDRSKITQESKGFIKVNFSPLMGKILGATIVSKYAGEMLPLLTLALEKKHSAYTLSSLVFSYPTKAEMIKKVCDMFVFDTLSHLKREVFSFVKKHFFQYLPFLLWGIILLTFFSLKYIYGFSYEQMALKLYQTIAHTGIYGGLIFIMAYGLRPIILFPASFMTVMSGIIWGPLGGMIYTILGSNLGGQVGYFLSRFLGKNIIDGKDEKTFLEQLKLKARTHPLLTVLGGRMLFVPYDLLSFSAGFIKLDWRAFTFGTLFGTIPGSLSFVLAGASLHGAEFTSFSQILSTIDTTLLYFAAGVFILSIVLSKILKKYLK